MYDYTQFFIDGAWVDPAASKKLDVVNPATEEVIGHISAGTSADLDKAVAAARKAFETFSQTTREERLTLLGRIIEVYQSKLPKLGQAISDEMGAPLNFAIQVQAGVGLGHFMTAQALLKDFV